MPRHDPDYPPSVQPDQAGRRLSPVSGTRRRAGLLGEPPPVSRAERQRTPDDPAGRRGPRIRWRTGRQAATLLCLASLVLLGWFWWQAANVPAAVSPISSVNSSENGEATVPEPGTGPTASSAGTDTAPGGSGDGAPARIIVHVAGAVVRAGIVELPQGSRLHEAIAAAGGGAPDADPDQLNLAAILEDGQKVLVPRHGETVPAGSAPAGDAGGGPAGAAGSPVGGKINLNTAGVDELASLPRIGPVLAQRIVDWRTEHGRFQRVEELDAVDGVGVKMLEALLPLVQV